MHQQAHARGALRVELETALDNVSARRLYEAFGYQAETGFVHYSRRV